MSVFVLLVIRRFVCGCMSAVSAKQSLCGSGATAAAVVAIKNKGLPNPVSVAMSGGELLCGWVEDGEAWLEGEITHVFDGVLDVAAYITR